MTTDADLPRLHQLASEYERGKGSGTVGESGTLAHYARRGRGRDFLGRSGLVSAGRDSIRSCALARCNWRAAIRPGIGLAPRSEARPPRLCTTMHAGRMQGCAEQQPMAETRRSVGGPRRTARQSVRSDMLRMKSLGALRLVCWAEEGTGKKTPRVRVLKRRSRKTRRGPAIRSKSPKDSAASNCNAPSKRVEL